MHSEPVLTLGLAAVAGVTLMSLGSRLGVPSIALLLLGGVGLGPSGLGWVDPEGLGHGLEQVIKMAVAVILFEGGLTLDISGYKKAPVVIGRMLTIGVLITWLGAAAALYAFAGLSPAVSLLGGSLVIVTGPTVVSPLLRRLNVRDRLFHVLYWEGVLIDAVGVFAAILCFEWATATAGYLWPVADFALRLGLGIGAGGLAGLFLDKLLRSTFIHDEMVNIFVLSFAIFLFGICDAILVESGILAVIVAGLVLGFRKPPRLRSVKRFKLELTELAIGLLFILLSARLDLQRFIEFGDVLLILLAIVMFGLRPINILVSTWGQPFDWREKAFMSWLAPRGIVAASMASLVTLRLTELGI
ncbi:MAG: NhaP-type Na+/H+ or K+/H+ antiporter, partial [Myxococcota bacterium]